MAVAVNGHDLAAVLRGEAARADTQATTVLAAFGVAAALAAGHAPAGWVAALWWAGLAAGAAGAGLLGMVVYPRTPQRCAAVPTVLLNGWHILAAERAGVLAEAYARTAGEGDAAAEQAHLVALARVVARKFRYVRLGLRVLAASGLLCAAALAGGA